MELFTGVFGSTCKASLLVALALAGNELSDIAGSMKNVMLGLEPAYGKGKEYAKVKKDGDSVPYSDKKPSSLAAVHPHEDKFDKLAPTVVNSSSLAANESMITVSKAVGNTSSLLTMNYLMHEKRLQENRQAAYAALKGFWTVGKHRIEVGGRGSPIKIPTMQLKYRYPILGLKDDKISLPFGEHELEVPLNDVLKMNWRSPKLNCKRGEVDEVLVREVKTASGDPAVVLILGIWQAFGSMETKTLGSAFKSDLKAIIDEYQKDCSDTNEQNDRQGTLRFEVLQQQDLKSDPTVYYTIRDEKYNYLAPIYFDAKIFVKAATKIVKLIMATEELPRPTGVTGENVCFTSLLASAVRNRFRDVPAFQHGPTTESIVLGNVKYYMHQVMSNELESRYVRTDEKFFWPTLNELQDYIELLKHNKQTAAANKLLESNFYIKSADAQFVEATVRCTYPELEAKIKQNSYFSELTGNPDLYTERRIQFYNEETNATFKIKRLSHIELAWPAMEENQIEVITYSDKWYSGKWKPFDTADIVVPSEIGAPSLFQTRMSCLDMLRNKQSKLYIWIKSIVEVMLQHGYTNGALDIEFLASPESSDSPPFALVEINTRFSFMGTYEVHPYHNVREPNAFHRMNNNILDPFPRHEPFPSPFRRGQNIRNLHNYARLAMGQGENVQTRFEPQDDKGETILAVMLFVPPEAGGLQRKDIIDDASVNWLRAKSNNYGRFVCNQFVWKIPKSDARLPESGESRYQGWIKIAFLMFTLKDDKKTVDEFLQHMFLWLTPQWIKNPGGGSNLHDIYKPLAGALANDKLAPGTPFLNVISRGPRNGKYRKNSTDYEWEQKIKPFLDSQLHEDSHFEVKSNESKSGV